jgi:hypothetical protein
VSVVTVPNAASPLNPASRSWRPGAAVVIGVALISLALGAAMGVLWWWVTPSEQWVKLDGGFGAAQLSSPSWFAADGWFLILGVIAGAALVAATWRFGKRHPIALVVAIVIGSALVAFVAWTVGGMLGPPDVEAVAASAAVGEVIDGSIGLRALGVIAAPAVASLAILAMMLALAGVTDEQADWVPQKSM